MRSSAGYFWAREIWMVNTLEETSDLPYDNLPTEYEAYPAIRDNVKTYNLGAFIFAVIIFFMVRPSSLRQRSLIMHRQR